MIQDKVVVLQKLRIELSPSPETWGLERIFGRLVQYDRLRGSRGPGTSPQVWIRMKIQFEHLKLWANDQLYNSETRN